MKKEESSDIDRSLKVLAGASFIIFITTVLSKLLTYLYRIVIARYYNPEIYGIYSISLMIIGWITVLAGFGFAGGLTRYVSLFRGKKEEYKSYSLVKNTSLILILSGIIGALIIIFSSSFISNTLFKIPELKPFLIIFSLSIPFTLLAGIYFAVLKSYEKVGWLSFITNIIQNSVKLIVLLVLIYLGFSSKSIAWSYVTGIMVALLLAYIISVKKIPSLFIEKKGVNGKEIFLQVFSYSWPLIFFGFMASILSWTDTFMIGILKGAEQVGFYNAALPLALLITLSTDLFRQMLLPLITKEYGKNNLTAVRVISKQVTKWLFIVSIPIFAGLFLFPQEVIRLLFGAEYLPAATSLRILSIGFLISAVLDVPPEILSMKGRSKLILLDIIFIGILNLFLNYLLIPKYGITGAAIATMFSISLLAIVFSYQSWRDSGILIIKRNVLNVILSGIISIALIILISSQIGRSLIELIIIGAIFIVAYILSLFLTRSVDSSDYMILNAVKNKILRKNKVNPTALN